MKKEVKGTSGITLIALIVTIIILIILAGIMIGSLSGNNGILNQAKKARNDTEIAGEKEILETSTIEAIGKNKYANLKYDEFKSTLDTNSNNGVELEEADSDFYVTFIESQRVYFVDGDGNVEYLGDVEELENMAILSASPESNTTAQYVQKVDLTVRTGVAHSVDDVIIKYCWSTDNTTEPTEGWSSYTGSQITAKSSRTFTLENIVTTITDDTDLYLWSKAIVNGTETAKTFGAFSVKERTTLMAETGTAISSSAFLSNGYGIKRGYVRSVTFLDSFTDGNGVTHSLSDSNCWDVSANKSGNKNGKVLAWYTQDGDYYDVTIAQEGGVVANSDSRYLFQYIGSYVTSGEVSINNLDLLDTSGTTNMGSMFSSCSKVTDLDVSNFDTSKVTNMGSMFSSCSGLTNLDVSNFDTSKVISMSSMFSSCSKVTSLDVSNFDTSKVTNMSSMFSSCSKVTSLDISDFNTSNVTNMSSMFSNCSGLTSLDVSNFDTSEVTSMSNMFKSCSGLTNLNVSNIDTSKVTNMLSMFSYCGRVKSLDIGNFNTSSVTNMAGMFSYCAGLTSLDVSNFDTSKVTSMSNMFNGCSGLANLDVSYFDTSNVTTMEYMFFGSIGLTSIDVSNFDTSKVTNMRYMFGGSYNYQNLGTGWAYGGTPMKLTKIIGLENFNTENVTNMEGLFKGCTSLQSLNLSGFDTANVTNMSYMFDQCRTLTGINLSSFDTSKVTNMSSMFHYCNNMSSIDISNFNTQNVTNMSSMFRSCELLTTIYVGDNWNISKVTSSGSMFSFSVNLAGDIAYYSSITDITYAKYTGGYLTYKASN